MPKLRDPDPTYLGPPGGHGRRGVTEWSPGVRQWMNRSGRCAGITVMEAWSQSPLQLQHSIAIPSKITFDAFTSLALATNAALHRSNLFISPGRGLDFALGHAVIRFFISCFEPRVCRSRFASTVPLEHVEGV